ncbi:hypothetical protein IEN85_20075 [Pelagicoccus sp. NFK12]|uniref:Uncharacterized protein n=1 Tax=Pelagicoccus enzymogenes TaxID=2773457 RepID=A0A927FBI4_9BACT|nr:hypothetical protein [Pelagicoccus enzymogenes]MBD5781809.1 hypothetical protein [Pelagicoccus enzymogenes]MDQ8196565.1 hypothetical protein [Pelagicoccus enzymogenes]
MSAEARMKALDDIQETLNNKVLPIEEELIAVAPSPFVPDSGKKVVVEEEVEVVLTDEELLKELANYVNPTGIFMFGGEFYLIFKEKKLKVGSELGITYNGANYSVVITEITGSTYKISRGDSELQLKLK